MSAPDPAEARREPVTAADVALAVRLALTVLRETPDDVWNAPAGGLAWDCRETVDHLTDDLFAYAVQLGPATPPQDREVAFLAEPRRPGGPALTVSADPARGTAGLLEALEAGGALLVAMVRTTPPETRSHHVYGLSDPEGFAAMGVVETLVHTHDVATGLGLGWDPPADLCARALGRLFPDAPEGVAPWSALLWATGRGELPGRSRLTRWRWDGRVRDRAVHPPVSAQ